MNKFSIGNRLLAGFSFGLLLLAVINGTWVTVLQKRRPLERKAHQRLTNNRYGPLLLIQDQEQIRL
jgi:hypothetical protein